MVLRLSWDKSAGVIEAVRALRPPTTADNIYRTGTVWMDDDTDIAYRLMDITAGVATWKNTNSVDAGTLGRITALEDTYVRIEIFTEVSSTTGTITPPTGATIVLDQYGGDIDALCTTIDSTGQKPNEELARDSAGTVVEATLSGTGNADYSLSGTPTGSQYAIQYVVDMQFIDFKNLDRDLILAENIINDEIDPIFSAWLIATPPEYVSNKVSSLSGASTDVEYPSAKLVFDQLALKENLTNKSTDVTVDGASDIKYPSVKAVKTYTDGLVVGLLDDRGSHDASGNVFPSSGGSGTAGAILKGDIWYISVAGTLGGDDVGIGDSVRALTDTPGQTASNWDALETNIGYVPENVVNKVIAFQPTPDDTHYPSEKLLADQLALKAELAGSLTQDFNADLMTSNDSILAEIDKIVASSTTVVDVFLYDTSKDSDGGAWRDRCQGLSWYEETLNTATRGATRKFPALALIIAETNTITIYDATDSSVPMWMVFNTSGVSFLTSNIFINSGLLTSSTVINGVISVTNDTNGLGIINFISDSALWATTSPDFGGEYNTTLSGRNNASGYNQSSGLLLVNSSVNDGAMTVLPEAPIDAGTGLHIPTQIVPTAAGASWIKQDTTVIDATGAINLIACDINSNGVTLLISTTKLYIFHSIPSVDTALTSADYIFDTAGATGPHISGVLSSIKFTGELSFIAGSDEGIFEIDYDIITPTNSMVNQTSDTFVSGEQTGDIKGAWLSDSVAETITGTELITNGDFPTDISGWTATNATLSLDTQRLKIDADTTSASYASQSLTTVVGERYKVSFEFTLGNRGGGIFIGTTLNGFNNAILSSDTTGSYQVEFVATATTTYVSAWIASGSATYYGFFDNISVRLAEEDRSVNDNGLAVHGSLIKSAVATGADLMAYSGFSASNYLEQPYNADLDFGTGDFCIMGWVKFTSSGASEALVSRGAGTGTGFVIAKNSSDNLQFTYKGVIALTSTLNIPVNTIVFVVFRRIGTDHIFTLNSEEEVIINTADSVTEVGATLRFGLNSVSTEALTNGSLALWRVSAYTPTGAQIAKIYAEEKQLFQEGAKCLLSESTAVQALSHNLDNNLLYVGTAVGTDVFQGLERVETIDSSGTPTSDNIVAVSAVRDSYAIATAAEAVYNEPEINVREALIEADGQKPLPPSYASQFVDTAFSILMSLADTYYPLTHANIITGEQTSAVYISVDEDTDEMVVGPLGGGIYVPSFHLSFGNSASATIHASLFVTSAEDSSMEVERKVPINDIGAMSSGTIVRVKPGDRLQIYGRSDGAGQTATIGHANFRLHRIGR